MKYLVLVLMTLMSSLVWAGEPSTDILHEKQHERPDFFDYPTVGIWVAAPLGLSGRLGLGFKTSEMESVVVGVEAGQGGTKQFIGFRGTGRNSIWGTLDIAHWKTNQHAVVAEADSEYIGVELQVAIFRMGLMTGFKHARGLSLSGGIGASF